jgi:hypothetical protein
MPNDQPDQTNPINTLPVNPQPVIPPIPEPAVVTPPMDIPPMPEQSMETPMADGSAAPSVDMPPMVTGGGPTKTKKKFGGGKFIPTILGLLILTGAVSAGAYLVRQNQDVREKAAGACDASHVGDREITSCTTTDGCSGQMTSTCIMNGPNLYYWVDGTCVKNDANCPEPEVTCVNKNQSCATQPCCEGQGTCQTTPYGKVCADPTCTAGQTKCQAEGSSFFEYTCQNGGFVKTKTCPEGCSGNVCANTATCVNLSQTCSDSKPCCEGQGTCQTTPYGKVCAQPTCTAGQTKCQAEGSSYFQYNCDNGGFVKTKNCGTAGCNGNVCATSSNTCTTTGDCVSFCNPDNPACCGGGSDLQNCSEPGCKSASCQLNQGKKECYCTGTNLCTNWIENWSVCTTAGNTNSCTPNSKKCYQTRFCATPGINEYQIAECDCGTVVVYPQCSAVKAYKTDWTALNTTQLSALAPGTVVRFTVLGANGTFTQARFKITGDTTWRTPVTTKKLSTDEFYTEYTIPTTGGTITVEAQVGTSTDAWY